MADIVIADVTTGVVDGPGMFDQLMRAVNAQLTLQFDANRLTGAEYATVYLGSMQSAMSTAVQYVLGEQSADKQADLLTQKIITEESQTQDLLAGVAVGGTVAKQQNLLQAQTDGFTRDAEQKLLKIATDVYSVRRGTDTTTPENGMNIINDNISEVFAKAAEGVGLTKNADTDGTLNIKAP